ncbi:DUF4887 domain-containing protein, partial [Staphylococcus aureus]|nr:DUF4887 domain-containing protein [Staphylococcus aureus]
LDSQANQYQQLPQQNQYKYVTPHQQAPTKQRPAKEENDDKASKVESKDKDDYASQDKSDDNQKKTDDNKQPAQPKP